MVELSGEKQVEGVLLPVAGIELPAEDEGENWPSPSIYSYKIFIYVLCDLLARSCLL